MSVPLSFVIQPLLIAISHRLLQTLLLRI